MEPLNSFMEFEGVNGIYINEPGTVWVEQFNCFQSYKMQGVERQQLLQFAHLIAEISGKEIIPENHLLSATLPNGAQAQIVMPPACDQWQFIVSINCQPNKNLKCFDDVASDITDPTQQLSNEIKQNDEDQELLNLYTSCQYNEFLKKAIRYHKNIIISGDTNTERSTFLNAQLKEVSLNERIITIEKQREIISAHLNSVHLLAYGGNGSVANISQLNLLNAALHLRPDRIVLSEISGHEALPYLQAINSGYSGSITTLQAVSPAHCFDQLASMVQQSGSSLSKAQSIAYAKNAIDIVVQLKRKSTGEPYIFEVYYNKACAILAH